MLVALPASIAFSMIVFAPLGNEFTGEAAISGMVSVIFLSIIAALLGGTHGLITAPCAPASAVLSLFVVQMVKSGDAPSHQIPLLVALLGLFAGAIQVGMGILGGGRIIKYIPYPVVAGFLSASGILILKAQLPKWLGLPKGAGMFDLMAPAYHINFESLIIGAVTLVVLYFANSRMKRIPAVVAGLAAGVLTYALLALFDPGLRTLDVNFLVIGSLKSARADVLGSIYEHWSGIPKITSTQLARTTLSALTLDVILSMDTL